jgi:hypothetical protein
MTKHLQNLFYWHKTVHKDMNVYLRTGRNLNPRPRIQEVQHHMHLILLLSAPIQQNQSWGGDFRFWWRREHVAPCIPVQTDDVSEKLNAVRTSETSSNFNNTTQHNIPEHIHLQSSVTSSSVLAKFERERTQWKRGDSETKTVVYSR